MAAALAYSRICGSQPQRVGCNVEHREETTGSLLEPRRHAAELLQLSDQTLVAPVAHRGARPVPRTTRTGAPHTTEIQKRTQVERLVLLSAHGPSRVLVCPDNRSIDVMQIPVELPASSRRSLEFIEHAVPHPRGSPPPEPTPGRGPWTEALRQVAPGRAGSEHPKDRAQDSAMVPRRTTGNRALGREEGREALPLPICKLMSFAPAVLPRVCTRALAQLPSSVLGTVLAWFVPIRHAEAHDVFEQRWNRFEDLLVEDDPDLLDLGRTSLV